MNEILIQKDGEEASIRLPDQLPIEYNSPFVDASEIYIGNTRKNPRGAYNISENVLLPNSVLNIMKMPHLLSIRNRTWKFQGAKLRSGGRIIDSGNAEVLKIKRNLDNGTAIADLTILFNNSDFLEAIGEDTLHDLQLGGIIPIPSNPVNEDIWPWTDYNNQISKEIRWLGDNHYTNLPYSDECCLATNVWATNVVINGHDYVCFPSFKGRRSDNEDDIVICNMWDNDNSNLYGYNNLYMINGTPINGFTEIADKKSFRNPIIPCYYLHQVIRHCFKDYGFSLQFDPMLDDEYFKSIALLNTYSIVRESIVYLSGLRHGVTISGVTQPLTNYPKDDTNAFLMQESTEINPINHLEKIGIKEFLQDFCLNFGCRFNITPDRKVYIERLELEKTSKVHENIHPEPEIISTKFEGFQLKYNLSKDDSLAPIDKFSKFLTSLRETDSRPFSPILSSNEYGLDRSLNTVENEALEKYLNNLIPYTVESTKKVYEISIPPAACSLFHYPKYALTDAYNHKYTEDDTGSNAWMPFIDSILQEFEPDFYNYFVDGIIDKDDSDGDGIRDYYLKLNNLGYVQGEAPAGNPIMLKTIYHGLVPDSGWISMVYPYASNHNFKPGSPTSLGWFHLGLLGSQGVIETFIRLMMKVWLSPEYHLLRLAITWDDILSKKWNQCENIRGIKYYVSKYKFNTPIYGLVEAECYPLNANE